MSNLETRPALYLANLTNDELVSFCQSYAESAMEKELLKRFIELDDTFNLDFTGDKHEKN